MPAHAHTLPRLPLSYVWSYGVTSPGNFMPRHPRVLYSGPIAFLYQHVTVTNSACLHLNSHLSAAGLRRRPIDGFEISARFAYLNDFITRSSLVQAFA